MAEDDLDTQGTPPEDSGQEPGAEPTEPQEPTEPTEGTEPAEPQDVDEALVDRIVQKVKSYQGRKLTEMEQRLQQHNMGLLQQMQQNLQQQSKPKETPPDPSEDATAWYRYMRKQETVEQQQKFGTIGTIAQGLIQRDPLVQQYPQLGEMIAQDILQNRGSIDLEMTPTASARQAVLAAKDRILTGQALQKQNPLSKNQPANVPLGNVAGPGNTKTGKKVKLPKLDPLTKKMAKKWGYSDEDLARVYSDEE